MEAWTLNNEDGTSIEVASKSGDVELTVCGEAAQLTTRIDPEAACVLATNIVRAAASTGKTGGPVSMYMPLREWDALIELADETLADSTAPPLAMRAVNIMKMAIRGKHADVGRVFRLESGPRAEVLSVEGEGQSAIAHVLVVETGKSLRVRLDDLRRVSN